MERAAATTRDKGYTFMSEGVSGRTAVITGASSGIGRRTARALAAAGARVALLARRPECE